MISYIHHSDIQTDKWDACIRKSLNSLTYAYSWYLDIVVQEWDALVLNDYEAVFPLPKKIKYKLQYSCTPFWLQQLGLFSQTASGLNRLQDFIEAIPKEFLYINLNLNSANSLVEGAKIKYNNNYVLTLDKSHSELEANYSKNLKRNLKKAQKANLQLFKNDSPKSLISLFRSDKGAQFTHFKDHDYQNLEILMNASIYRHCGQITMAYDEGNRAVAGIFVLYNHNRAILLFTGNSNEGRACGALALLINEVIEQLANTGTSFDFEGSNTESLARFYKGFGASNQRYPSIVLNRLPLFLRWLKS